MPETRSSHRREKTVGDEGMTLASKRKADKERLEREAKRFAPGQKRHPNDLVVNQALGKVKIEEPGKEVVVKEEVDLGLDSVSVEDSSGGGISSEATNGNAEEELENDSVAGSNIDENRDEEMSVKETEGNDEEGLNYIALGFEKCSKVIADLREENLLLKRQLEEKGIEMEEMKRRNQGFEGSQGQGKDPSVVEAMEMNHDDLGHSEKSKELGDAGDERDNLTLENPFFKGIDDLKKENGLQKEQLEENRLTMEKVELQIEHLKDLQKISFVKLRNVCPPPGEENNPIVVAGKVLPILFARGYVGLKTMLQSRMVCKTWGLEVDTFLENPPSRRPFCKMESQLETRRWAFEVLPSHDCKLETQKLKKNYTLDCPSTVQGFLERFEKSERNPFLGRIASFQVSEISLLHSGNEPLDEVKLYWQNVGELLKKFGKYLWYVTINQYDLELTPLELYKLLEKCLPHLENVKGLTIYGRFEDSSLETELSSDRSFYMAKNPLPLLPNLRYLNFQFPTVHVLEAILKTSPSLSALVLFGNKIPLKKCAKAVGKLPIKDLSLVTKPSDVQSLMYLSKDLETLDLDFSNNGKDNKIGLSELVRMLKQFTNLSVLKLKGIISLDEKPVDGDILKSLSVESFELLNCYNDKKECKGALEDLIKREGFYAQIMFRFPNLRFLNIEDKRQAIATTPKDWKDYPEGFDWNFEVWSEFKSLEAFNLKSVYQYQDMPGESNTPNASKNKSSARNKDAMNRRWTRPDGI